MNMNKIFQNRLLLWTAAIVFGLPLSSFAAGRNPPAKLKVDATPIERDMRTGHSYSPVIKKASASVVNVSVTQTVNAPRFHRFFDDPVFDRFFGDRSRSRGGSREFKREGAGSGVIVTEDGYILTNNHVVDGADENGIEIVLSDGKTMHKARIVGKDPQTDLALLKIDAANLPAITLADSDVLEVGDVVLAIGNPFNLGQSVSLGIISALGRGVNMADYEDFIQTDAAINQGNSGGALVDARGRLIGINQSIASPSGGSVGVGFAVPVNLAKVVMERLVEDGMVRRGFLGVMIQEVTPDLARAFSLPDTGGALVSAVQHNTPADKAGIQEGDVIVEVNGKKATDSQHARLMISQQRPGSEIKLAIYRDGRAKTITAKLAEFDRKDAATFGDTESVKTSEHDSLDGVEVDGLTAAVRREFGIPDDVNGALVTNVDPESNAFEAGLRQGHVIQSINRKAVDVADKAVKLSEQAQGEQVLLRVWQKSGPVSGSRYLTVDNLKKK
jgi:serine protease Do